MDHAFTRGDVVACGSASYVVWTHGQGTIQAFPRRDGAVNVGRTVDGLIPASLRRVGRLSAPSLASLRAMVAEAVRVAAERRKPLGWNDAPDAANGGSLDGRYRVDPWGSPGGQWVQPCRAAA